MYACVAAAICAFICILQNQQVVFSRTKDSNDYNVHLSTTFKIIFSQMVLCSILIERTDGF